MVRGGVVATEEGMGEVREDMTLGGGLTVRTGAVARVVGVVGGGSSTVVVDEAFTGS